MSDTASPAPANGNGAPPPPPLVIEIQYVKDLSFEVPNGPQIFAILREQPQLDLDVDLEVKQLQENANVFEVALILRVETKAQEMVCYILELTYCGVFTLNLPPEHAQQVLGVDCPRLLFPYARSIISEVSAQGAFPALMLPPVDIAQLIHAKRMRQQAQASGVA